jgi:hypothetical protein
MKKSIFRTSFFSPGALTCPLKYSLSFEFPIATMSILDLKLEKKLEKGVDGHNALIYLISPQGGGAAVGLHRSAIPLFVPTCR